MSIEFKARLKKAVALVHAHYSCLPLQRRELSTPVWRGQKFGWIHVMDTDGLLVARRPIRTVFDGETPSNLQDLDLLVGVAVQSEKATGETKPNPLGKASAGRAPMGVWVDLEDGVRTRLDRLYVVFVMPRATPSYARKATRKKFEAVQRAVAMAIDVNSHCSRIVMDRGDSAKSLSRTLIAHLKGTLRGRGRPPGKEREDSR